MKPGVWIAVAACAVALGSAPSHVLAAENVCCLCAPSDHLSDKTCITGPGTTCEEMAKSSANAALKNVFCDAVILKQGECKPKGESGGLCPLGPVADTAYTTAETPSGPGTPLKAPIVPSLIVPIPGLNFSTQLEEKGGKIPIPFFAQYISAAYRYLTGLSAIAAAVMIVWGGFRYMFGATIGSTQRGKAIMIDAVIGLLLVLGAYTILNTINPELLGLKALDVTVIKPDPQSYMGGRFDAPKTLEDVGVTRGDLAGATAAEIPSGSCPGRDPNYTEPGDDKYIALAGQKILKKNYTLCSKGRCLDQKTIDFYLNEQKRTGVPAAVIMAQIVTEAGVSAVFNLADGGGSTLFYNYGGIGCTQKQVPQDSCAHVAFGATAFDLGTKKPHPLPCTKFNSSDQLGPSCVNICENSSRDAFVSCGDNCFPLKSHAAVVDGGVEVWIPSVQCSRKFKTPQEFLDSHVGFVRPCMAYRDSVYKFAYCIGASTYAGVTGSKGLILAEIIERNCLCDPKTDSLGCVRNKELETKLAKNIIKKRNLYDSRFYKNGEPDLAAIAQALLESTGGLLTAGTQLPQNDIVVQP